MNLQFMTTIPGCLQIVSKRAQGVAEVVQTAKKDFLEISTKGINLSLLSFLSLLSNLSRKSLLSPLIVHRIHSILSPNDDLLNALSDRTLRSLLSTLHVLSALHVLNILHVISILSHLSLLSHLSILNLFSLLSHL